MGCAAINDLVNDDFTDVLGGVHAPICLTSPLLVAKMPKGFSRSVTAVPRSFTPVHYLLFFVGAFGTRRVPSVGRWALFTKPPRYAVGKRCIRNRG